MTKNKTTFAELLLNWHSHIDRNLPWKETRDPYKIWLSEIIMQQTRVAQGTPYYLKFIDAFPTIVDLANASENHVMKLWQGLGYYSRARNLHFTAKTVRDQYEGVFPEKYEDILSLKGIGKYTAAAISSFAYGGVYPVVDGNVIRLISRYFGITDAVDTNSTLKTINQHAQKLILGSNPADFNQAIMDFGALICSP
ncbi:MAG: A/G-specific adenine glycosylase, partial [Saprospiraceae bacterium]|nr:A/G-specific adenine glycosylase [Saprospiraceae bacterium]